MTTQVRNAKQVRPIAIPHDYDYVGVYLTNRCHLSCPYCITHHHGASYRSATMAELSPEQWIDAVNRLELPAGVPITLQGGEPFLYKGIWDILENVWHKVDILTALPPFLEKEHFSKLSTLDWNRRPAPYPTIRVSYHKGQHKYERLIERLAEIKDIVSIGLYYLDHPAYSKEEFERVRSLAQEHGVELRKKEFLGRWNGRMYGTYLYEDAAVGHRMGTRVLCRNTVVPVAPDGTIYRCHSDLYFGRKNLSLGNITDDVFAFRDNHLVCENYGLCSECDVKVKTNHEQVYGYTSVDIRFCSNGGVHEFTQAKDPDHQGRVLGNARS